jgi:hypothetical protein
MTDKDQAVREELRLAGTLFDGYHPQMEALHKQNSARLEEILTKHGWPGQSLVGRHGAAAAWLILQHAISSPSLMRRALPLLQAASQLGEVEAQHVALLEDRICIWENRPQRYGTQYDWDENGEMNPFPIANIEQVDELRRSVGLDSLEENTQRIRESLSNERAPKDLAARKLEVDRWAHKVGWR